MATSPKLGGRHAQNLSKSADRNISFLELAEDCPDIGDEKEPDRYTPEEHSSHCSIDLHEDGSSHKQGIGNVLPTVRVNLSEKLVNTEVKSSARELKLCH